MLLEELFSAFIDDEPLPIMARGLLEHALFVDDVNRVFETSAVRQYTRALLFSDIISLMSVVALNQQPSLRAAYLKRKPPVSLTAVYDKLQGISQSTNVALLEHVVMRLNDVIGELGTAVPSAVPGYEVRILDGNALGATQHRLEVLRGISSGPLPGKSLVVLNPQTELAEAIIPCEDGHAQERSLFDEVLKGVQPRQVWIADRNFCTVKLLGGIAEREATFVIREHRRFPGNSIDDLVEVGECENGIASEQAISFRNASDEVVQARRIVISLKKATRDKDQTLTILTNLPREAANAMQVAELYRKRWTIETFFATLTTVLSCEVDTLGYPKAALFAFTVALVAANVLATIRAALRHAHGQAAKSENISNYSLVNTIQSGSQQLVLRIAPLLIAQVHTVSGIVDLLKRCAARVPIKSHEKAPTRKRAQEAAAKRGSPADPPHVSTARLLAAKRVTP